MRILFYDDTWVYVTTEQGEVVKQAVKSGAEWIEISDTMYAVKAIKQIQADKPVPNSTLAIEAGVDELPEEKRIHNIAKIRQLRQRFLNRRKVK